MTNSTETESDRTLWCGNLSNDKVTEEVLFELFLQAGPLVSVKVPNDKEGRKRNFGFILFKHSCSVPYAIKLMSGLRLHGRQLNLQFRPGSVHQTPPRGGPGNQGNDGFLSPTSDERGMPNFNGPQFNNNMRMWPPPQMQSLMSPPGERSMNMGMNRSYSAPTTQLDEKLRLPPPRDRSKDNSRDNRGNHDNRDNRNNDNRDRSHDRGRESRDRSREDRDYSKGRHNDRRDYSRGREGQGRDRDYRNSSQDRNNEGGVRRAETFHGFSAQQTLMGAPSLLGAPPGGEMDMRPRQGGHQRSQSQRDGQSLPPWQRPY